MPPRQAAGPGPSEGVAEFVQIDLCAMCRRARWHRSFEKERAEQRRWTLIKFGGYMVLFLIIAGGVGYQVFRTPKD